VQDILYFNGKEMPRAARAAAIWVAVTICHLSVNALRRIIQPSLLRVDVENGLDGSSWEKRYFGGQVRRIRSESYDYTPVSMAGKNQLMSQRPIEHLVVARRNSAGRDEHMELSDSQTVSLYRGESRFGVAFISCSADDIATGVDLSDLPFDLQPRNRSRRSMRPSMDLGRNNAITGRRGDDVILDNGFVIEVRRCGHGRSFDWRAEDAQPDDAAEEVWSDDDEEAPYTPESP
jgi:hypothetical protein